MSTHVYRRFSTVLVAVTLALTSALTGCGKRISNGESIYLTGKNLNGDWMDSNFDRTSLHDPTLAVSCSSCHGVDRAGGRNTIPELGPYAAPALTRAALFGDRGGRRPPYTVESLKEAIVRGRSSSGARLHYPMPRWKMSEKDLTDLATWLLNTR